MPVSDHPLAIIPRKRSFSLFLPTSWGRLLLLLCLELLPCRLCQLLPEATRDPFKELALATPFVRQWVHPLLLPPLLLSVSSLLASALLE